MVFIRFILVVLLIFLILQLLFRYIVPWLLKRFVNNIKQNFGMNAGNNGKEGEITVEPSQSSRKKKIEKDEGEYIKFEEIDE
ncbi:MAG: DUF4834 family protein [Bacteroidetes bacterium]|nr:DUF4834 family protein [Bacteroidota bacterium]